MLLALDICGMTSTDDVPVGFPVDPDEASKRKFVAKLAAKVVDTVFVRPANIDTVLKLSGEPSQQPSFCLCDGGNLFLFSKLH